MPVLCDQVSQCLGSLTFSLVSKTSANDFPSMTSPGMMPPQIMSSSKTKELLHTIACILNTAHVDCYTTHTVISAQNRLFSAILGRD